MAAALLITQFLIDARTEDESLCESPPSWPPDKSFNYYFELKEVEKTRVLESN